MDNNIPIRLSFLPDWFDRHFFNRHRRPDEASDEEMGRLYLERKRFLHENFGDFGIGEANPALDGERINRIGKYCCDFIPYILGVKLECIDAGFYNPHPLTEEEIKKLKPVDLAELPLGEWIVRRKEKLNQLYGSAEMGLYLEGSMNGAFRIRGVDIYADLLLNPSFVRDLFQVINETVVMAYKFLAETVGVERVVLWNCTVNHIGPDIYEQLCLPNDLYVVRETRESIPEHTLDIHHCDLPVEKFLDAYAKIPRLHALDGSHTSNIPRIKESLPGVDFLAMVNPMVVDRTPEEEFQRLITNLLEDGADAINLIQLDPNTGIERLRTLMKIVERCCEKRQLTAEFEMDPLCEEEIEWAFPRYQGRGLHHRDDDWRSLIPKA
jgi:hypothetical protein